MTVTIRPEALEELLASARWYQQQRLGLGDELIDEAWSVLERIQAAPLLFGRYEYYRGANDVRRAGFARFPYGVIYLVEAEKLVVLAFAPDRRRPLYWQDRLRHETL